MKVYNVQQALKSGVSQNEIQSFLAEHPEITPSTALQQPQAEAKPKSHGLLDLLPTALSIGGGLAGGAVGAAAGGVGAPVGLVAGSAGGSALGKFLENLITGEDPSQDVLKEGAIGGVSGGVGLGIGRLLGPAARSVGGGLFRGGTIAAKSTLGRASEQEALQTASRKYLGNEGLSKILGGTSGTAKFQKVEPVINKLTNQVDDLLKSVPNTVPASNFSKTAAELRATITEPSELHAFDRIYGRLIQDGLGGQNVQTLNATQLNAMKRILNSEATSAFRQVEAGTPLSPVNRAILDLREAADRELVNVAPAELKGTVDVLNKDASTLIKGIPELKRTSEQGANIFGLNIQTPTRGLQWLRDTTGRGAMNAGQSAGGLNPILQQLAGQAGVRTVAGNGSQPTIDQAEASQPFDTSNLPATQADTGNATNQQSILFKAMALNDLQTTGGKNLDKIITLAKFINPDIGKNQTQQQSDTFFNLATNAIDSIYKGETTVDPETGEVIGKTDRFGYGPLPGKLYEAALAVGGAGVPEGAIALNQKYTILRLNILRAFNGARISDADYALAQRYIPNISDTNETAKIKIGQLKSFLKETRQSASTQGEDTSGLDSLLGGLGQ